MSLYDPENPQHLSYLAGHRARWTPEKEAALQHQFALMGLKGDDAKRLAEEAVERGEAEPLTPRRW